MIKLRLPQDANVTVWYRKDGQMHPAIPVNESHAKPINENRSLKKAQLSQPSETKGSDYVDFGKVLRKLITIFDSYLFVAGTCNRLQGGVKAEEIGVILELHNQYRARVANGQERRGRGGRAQPPAANMRQLVNRRGLGEVIINISEGLG